MINFSYKISTRRDGVILEANGKYNKSNKSIPFSLDVIKKQIITRFKSSDVFLSRSNKNRETFFLSIEFPFGISKLD